VDCAAIIFTGHAFARMFGRGISIAEVREVVVAGETIAEYPDDLPFPSRVMLGKVGARVLHVVAARDEATARCYVITAYEPDPAKWELGFRRRKR
jgi:hypothetical protein